MVVSLPCSKCDDAERTVKVQLAAKDTELAARAKEVKARDKEIAELQESLAKSRAQEQREREAHATAKEIQARRIADLEDGLRTALARPSRELELEHAVTLLTQQVAGLDVKLKAAEARGYKTREELIKAKERVFASEAETRLAEESRQAYVAEAAEGAEREKAHCTQLSELQAELKTERDANERTRTELARAIAQLADEAVARASLEKEVAEASEQLRISTKERESALAYEGACADNRRLQKLLSESEARCREVHGRSQAIQQLEQRIEALTAEQAQLVADKAQLLGQVAHLEHLKNLFQTVTSRTHEVQEAANSVMKQVEASKQARQAGHESERQQYAAPDVSMSASAVSRKGHTQPSISNFAKVPVPPSGPRAPRHGGPNRHGVHRS